MIKKPVTGYLKSMLNVKLLLRQQYMSKPSFRRKPESRIGLDAGSGSGMTFDMFNCRSNK